MKHPPFISVIVGIPLGLAIFMGGRLALEHADAAPAPAPQKFIPVAAAARTYMRANPVPPVAGMIAGIVTEQIGDVAWTCAPHGGRGTLVGNCWFWAGSLLTATGQTVTFTCGQIGQWTFSPATSVSCTSAVPDDGVADGYVPEPGDYVYVPADLKVTRENDVRIIRNFAIDAEDTMSGIQGVPAQCDVTDWTAVHSCEYPTGVVTPVPVPSSPFPTVFGPSGSGGNS
jgi:hypothetical protein